MSVAAVSVTDAGGKTGHGIVNITIEEVNEFAPVFLQAMFKGSVVENAAAGSSVITVSALDGDKGPIHGKLLDHVCDEAVKGAGLLICCFHLSPESPRVIGF